MEDGGPRTSGRPGEGRPAGGTGPAPAPIDQRPGQARSGGGLPTGRLPLGPADPPSRPAATGNTSNTSNAAARPTGSAGGNGAPRPVTGHSPLTGPARPPMTAPSAPGTARPLAPPRRIDALLDSATRPLRDLFPRSAEPPTRQLPRTVPPPSPVIADERPTTLIAAARDAREAVVTVPPAEERADSRLDGAPISAPISTAGSAFGGEDAPRLPEPQVAVDESPALAQGRREPRSFKRALLAAAVSTLAPGSGHLLMRRRRTGAALLGLFVFGIALLVVLVATLPRAQLLEHLLSTRVLIVGALVCLAAAATWMAVIVHAYLIGRPRRMPTGQKVIGAVTVAALCLVVAAPLGLAAHVANSQRSLLDALFPSGGAEAAAAIGKPRLNILLVGSDAGPDRTGTRTDTMMVASIDTKTGRTTLFGLPRNIGFARFPPGSPMAAKFPDGFHDDSNPLSGDYLLNAVYAYGHAFPQLAPKGPTSDPGLNLLQSSISHMLGLPIDYQIVVDMAGFAALIDALGGLQVDVGSERIPIGGIGPHGEKIRPKGYIEPGLQQLSGEQALAYARSRTGSSDYVRMGRQRCLIQYVLDQKSPTDLLTNFQAVARATTATVTTNIPRELLPALVALAGREGSLQLESIAFDPNLPDPGASNGRFSTYNPDVPYMREVVREAINRPPAAAPPAGATPSAPSPAPTSAPSADDSTDISGDSGSSTSRRTTNRADDAGTARSRGSDDATAVPESLADSCSRA